MFYCAVCGTLLNNDECLVCNIRWKSFRDSSYYVSTDGHITGKSGFLLKPGLESNGYPQVVLYLNTGKQNFRVHRVVMEAFQGPSELKVNHIDGSTTNNKLTNLEYCTQSENMLQAAANGNMSRKKSALTETDVHSIRDLYTRGKYSQRALGRMFGVSGRGICDIVNYKSWKHI